MIRIMKECDLINKWKSDRSWLPVEKTRNSFSRPVENNKTNESEIFKYGTLDSNIEKRQINL